MSVPRVLGSVAVVRRCDGPGGVLTQLLVVLVLAHRVLVRGVAVVHRVLERLGVAVEVALAPVLARGGAGACLTAHVRTVTARRTLG